MDNTSRAAKLNNRYRQQQSFRPGSQAAGVVNYYCSCAAKLQSTADIIIINGGHNKKLYWSCPEFVNNYRLCGTGTDQQPGAAVLST